LKTKLSVLLLALIFAILTACGSTEYRDSGVAVPPSVADSSCPTGVSLYPVTVEMEDDNFLQTQTVQAYVIRPNEGCNLPVLYCVFLKTGYGAGEACSDDIPLP
jgi:hypothetical protein